MGILLTTVAVLKKENERLANSNTNFIAFAKKDSIKIEYYRNSRNQEVAKNEVLTLSEKDARELRDTELLSIVNQFEGIKKNMKNLEQVSRTTMSTVGSFKALLKDSTYNKIDSATNDTTIVTRRIYDNRDPWIKLTGFIEGDSISMKADVPTPLASVLFIEKGRFIWKKLSREKKYTIASTSENPYTRITKNEVIRIEKKK